MTEVVPATIACFIAVGFLVIALPLKPGVYVGVAMVSALLGLTPLVGSSLAVSLLARMLVCFWLLCAVLKQNHDPVLFEVARSRRLLISDRAKVFLGIWILYSVLFAWMVLANASQELVLIERLIGVFIVGFGALLLLNIVVPLLPAVIWPLTAAVVLSLIMGLVVPDVALVRGRLAGLFANPNSIGLIAAALVAAVALEDRISALGFFQLIMAWSAIVWSASRTAALVAAFLLLALLIRRGRGARKIVWYLIGAATAITVYWVVRAGLFSQLLFRRTESRTEWTWALEIVRKSPVHGAGDILTSSGKEVPSGVGSSMLTIAVWGGLVGMAIFSLIVAMFVLSAWRAGPRSLVLLAGFLVHSIFESWLAVPGSPFMLVFLFVWIAAMQLDDADGLGSAAVESLGHYRSQQIRRERLLGSRTYAVR